MKVHLQDGTELPLLNFEMNLRVGRSMSMVCVFVNRVGEMQWRQRLFEAYCKERGTLWLEFSEVSNSRPVLPERFKVAAYVRNIDSFTRPNMDAFKRLDWPRVEQCGDTLELEILQFIAE